jgi:hypothetical protein
VEALTQMQRAGVPVPRTEAEPQPSASGRVPPG